jgi:protein TonB
MVVDGKPKPVVFTVTMRFTLDDKKAPKVEGAVEGAVTVGVEGGVVGGVEGGVKGDVTKPTALQKFAAGAVRVEGEVKPPKSVKEVLPVYPEIARQARVQGVVILSVRTDEAGRVEDAIVLRSIPLLDQAAIDGIRQWVYEPLVVEGQARPAVFTVTVRFELK